MRKFVTRDITVQMNMILALGVASLTAMLKWNSRSFVMGTHLDSFVLLGPFVMLVILNLQSVQKIVIVPTLDTHPLIHLLVLLDIIVKKPLWSHPYIKVCEKARNGQV